MRKRAMGVCGSFTGACIGVLLCVPALAAGPFPGGAAPSPVMPKPTGQIGAIVPPKNLQPRIAHYVAHARGGTAYWYDARGQDRDRLRSEALRNPAGAPASQHSLNETPLNEMPAAGGVDSLPSQPGGRPQPSLPGDPRDSMPRDPGMELPSEQGRPMLEVAGKYWRGGWVYELKRVNGVGFAFGDVAQIQLDGSGVTATLLADTCVMTAVPNINSGGCGTPTSSRAFVLFTVAPEAPPGIRQVSVRLKSGAVEAAQYPLLIGRSGVGAIARLSYLDLPTGPLTLTNQDVRNIQGAATPADAPLLDVEVQGERLGNPKLLIACLLEGGIQSGISDERRVVLRGRFNYTAGRQIQNGQVAFTRPPAQGPFDLCPAILYDQAMDEAAAWAPGFPGTLPENFNYLADARPKLITIGPSVRDFARHPAALGDSLAHGVMHVATDEPTQRGAFPVLLVSAMGGRIHQQPPAADPGNVGLYMNFVRDLFSFEDLIKRRCPQLAGIDVSVFNAQIGLKIDACLTDRLPFTNVDPNPTTKPSHAGVSGFDYTTVLRTNGDCVDVLVKRTGCNDSSAIAQAALNHGSLTPIEVLEQIKPHFVIATVAGNHSLGCALTTLPLDACLDWGRFEEDATEVFDRLARIGEIRGGLVFSMPSPTAFAHLRSVTYRIPRLEFPVNQPPRLRMVSVPVKIPYWRLQSIEKRVQTSASFIASLANFVAALAAPLESLQTDISLAGVPATALNALADQLNRLSADIQTASLDATETERLETFTRAMNAKLQELAARNRYAFVDVYAMFEQFKGGGVAVTRLDGTPLCSVRGEFPLAGQAPGGKGCGVFSLDGFHPTHFGHAVLTQQLIAGLNAYYGLQIPSPDLGRAYQDDTLNQVPIDIIAYLRNAALGCQLPPPSASGVGQFLAQGGFLCEVNALPPTSFDGAVATLISVSWNANFLLGHGNVAFRQSDGHDYNFRAARQNANRSYACGRATPANWNPNTAHPKGLWCVR